MKLSELLADHPELDVDLTNGATDQMFLDGVYLFRAINIDDSPGESWVRIDVTPHTDGTIKRGLIYSAAEILANEWPVHVCGEGH